MKKVRNSDGSLNGSSLSFLNYDRFHHPGLTPGIVTWWIMYGIYPKDAKSAALTLERLDDNASGGRNRLHMVLFP
jgi:hypothetical protein